jgi:hypothetical protein
MKKLFLAATASLALIGAASTASAMPLGLPSDAAQQIDVVDHVALCFYIDGWNGPGMYDCGFRHRRGHGWHGARHGGGSMHRSGGMHRSSGMHKSSGKKHH